MRFVDQKLLKFLLVGIINTIVGCGLMFLLYNVFNISYWISSVCNYIFGGICSFFLNKYFTFQNKQKSFKQVLFFILNLALCYLIAYIGAKKLIEFLLNSTSFSEKNKGNIALLTGMILYTILNYLGQRIFVFAEKKCEIQRSEK